MLGAKHTPTAPNVSNMQRSQSIGQISNLTSETRPNVQRSRSTSQMTNLTSEETRNFSTEIARPKTAIAGQISSYSYGINETSRHGLSGSNSSHPRPKTAGAPVNATTANRWSNFAGNQNEDYDTHAETDGQEQNDEETGFFLGEYSDSDSYYAAGQAPHCEFFMFFSKECSPHAWCIGPNTDPKQCRMMCMDAAESPAGIKAVWLEEARGPVKTPSELGRTDMDGTDRSGHDDNVDVVRGGQDDSVLVDDDLFVGDRAKYVICRDMVVRGIGLFEFCRRCIRYACVRMCVCVLIYVVCVYVCCVRVRMCVCDMQGYGREGHWFVCVLNGMYSVCVCAYKCMCVVCVCVYVYVIRKDMVVRGIGLFEY